MAQSNVSNTDSLSGQRATPTMLSPKTLEEEVAAGAPCLLQITHRERELDVRLVVGSKKEIKPRSRRKRPEVAPRSPPPSNARHAACVTNAPVGQGREGRFWGRAGTMASLPNHPTSPTPPSHGNFFCKLEADR